METGKLFSGVFLFRLEIGIYLRFEIRDFLPGFCIFSVVPAGTLYSPADTRFPTDKSAGYFQPSLSGFFSAHRLMGFPCKTFPVIFLCLSRRDIRKIALAFMPGKYCLFYQKVPKRTNERTPGQMKVGSPPAEKYLD